MDLAFAVSETEYHAYNQYAYRRLLRKRPRGRFHWLGNVFIWMLVGAGFATVFQMASRGQFDFHWPTALCLTLLFSVLAVSVFYNQKRLGEAAVPEEQGLMRGYKTLKFSDDGITDIHPLGQSHYHWRAVQDVEVHQGSVYLFVDTLLAIIIPAEVFKDDNERGVLIDLVERNTGLTPSTSSEKQRRNNNELWKTP